MQQFNQYVRVGHVTKAPLYLMFLGAVLLIALSVYIASSRAQEQERDDWGQEEASNLKNQAQTNIVSYLEKVAKDSFLAPPDLEHNKSQNYYLDIYQDQYENHELDNKNNNNDSSWNYQFDPLGNAQDQLKENLATQRAQALMQALSAQASVSSTSVKEGLKAKSNNDNNFNGPQNGNDHSFAQEYVNNAASKIAHLQNVNGLNTNFNRASNLSTYQELVNNDTTMIGQIQTVHSPYLVRQGAVIPCTLLTGINSDLPGLVQAQVNEDVYDSPQGQHVLIPKGSKVIGQYASSVMMGQERLMMAFNRIIFPDGKAMDLGAMVGSSLDGYSGFNAQVDNHFFSLLTNAVLLGGVTAGISLSVDDKRDDDGNLTLNGALSQSLGQSLGRVLTNVIERNLNTAPTLKVKSGFAFNVTLIKDIYFNSPYEAYHY